MNPTLATELAKLLSDILEERVAADSPNARLVEDYGANSMDVVDIVMQIERKMGVRIADEDIPKLITFGDIVDQLASQRS